MVLLTPELRSSFPASQLSYSLPASRLTFLPPQAPDAEASTAGAVGAVQSRAGNSRLFIGGRPRLPGPRLALHNLLFLLPPVHSTGRGWGGGSSLVESSLLFPLTAHWETEGSPGLGTPSAYGRGCLGPQRLVNSPAPPGATVSLAGEVGSSRHPSVPFLPTPPPPSQGKVQCLGLALFNDLGLTAPVSLSVPTYKMAFSF